MLPGGINSLKQRKTKIHKTGAGATSPRIGIISNPPYNWQRFYLVAFFNSFVFDYFIRQKVTNHLSFYFVLSNPMPRLDKKDCSFQIIVQKAAQLICTSQEYDELAKSIGMKGWKESVMDQNERLRIRAELDGIIAHLYNLTEEEFAHILSTFPIVPEPVKSATLEAYRKINNSKVKTGWV